MRQLRVFLAKVIGFIRAAQRQRAFDEELESHIELHIDDNIRAGMTRDEARRRALAKLGGLTATRQAYHERSTLILLEHTLQDARLALRQLAQSPVLAATATLVLSLGVGAATSLIALVDAALVRPLPYSKPGSLVGVTEATVQIPRAMLSYPDFADWKRLNSVFESFDVYSTRGFMLASADGPVLAGGARVSSDFFRTLGVRPLHGRDFTAAEDDPGGPLTTILSHAAWQQRFGGDPSVIGRVVTLSEAPHEIVGVLPADFHFAPVGRTEFWVPLQPVGGCEERRSCHNLRGVARLKPGVSVQHAAEEMSAIAARLEREYPVDNKGQLAVVEPLQDVIVGDVRPTLLLLLGGAALLLLIACMNVAGLLLVRGERNGREVAVRAALGATRLRLLRRLFVDAVVLVALGTAGALLVSHWTIGGLIALVPEDMLASLPFLAEAGLNARVLASMAALSLLAVGLFALAPAIHLSNIDPRERLAVGGRGSSGLGWRKAGTQMVVLEVATAMVLLVGAGLLSKSLYRLMRVDLNFVPERVAMIRVALPRSVAASPEQSIAVVRDMLARVSMVPGVESAGITSVPPVSFNGNTDWIRFVGRPYNGEHNEVNARGVSPLYLRTIGVTLLSGRHFTDEDGIKRKVAIVNQTLAKMYFPNQNPIGQRFGDLQLTPDSIKEIIGVMRRSGRRSTIPTTRGRTFSTPSWRVRRSQRRRCCPLLSRACGAANRNSGYSPKPRWSVTSPNHPWRI
jgi:macrolide transport system ATP-binding/permease protein